MRICSFLPSGTEIVYALGMGDSLYAVSHECDYPAEALAKPKIVRSRFDADKLSSQEIDRLVTEMYQRGERIYEVDEDVLREAAPDLVITQELCDVCAVSYEDVRHAASRLAYPPNVVSLDPASIGNMLEDIEMVGDLCGVPDAATAFIAELNERIEAVRSRAAAAASAPRVACIEWLEPPIVAGHWIPQMVELAGGVDALAKPGEASRRITMEGACGVRAGRAGADALRYDRSQGAGGVRGAGEPRGMAQAARRCQRSRLLRGLRLVLQPQRAAPSGRAGADGIHGTS